MTTDPVIRYARDLAALMASCRDLLNDPAYAVMLPHLQALATVLPTRLAPTACVVDLPGPRPAEGVVMEPPL